jgi:hypothetical protein
MAKKMFPASPGANNATLSVFLFLFNYRNYHQQLLPSSLLPGDFHSLGGGKYFPIIIDSNFLSIFSLPSFSRLLFV